MTVTYTAEVASCQRFGCFLKLLWRWRGSIYKLVWMDLLLFLFLFYSINLIYIYILADDAKKTFENIVQYCSTYTSLIPLSFVLGFYVNLVMARWWDQYITIPWPDSIAVFVSAYVHGQDEGGRVMRRTVMRYVCLCLAMALSMISPCVKRRFPRLKSFVDAGLLLDNERQIFEKIDAAFPKYPKHWMPIIWAGSIITRARREGRIRDDYAVKTIIDELNVFRGKCGTLMFYDFISIPLVYTQVVTIAVYSFFICTILANQWTETKLQGYETLDFYMPIFITLQFAFYMGWLKVAETLINPFGEDDDDFEVNWMIDRNLQVSYLIVDEMHLNHPDLVKDQYWDQIPEELPYEEGAKREQPPEASTAKYDVQESLNSKNNISNYFGFGKSKSRTSIASDNEIYNSSIIADECSSNINEIERLQNITSYTRRETMSAEERAAEEKQYFGFRASLQTLNEVEEEYLTESFVDLLGDEEAELLPNAEEAGEEEQETQFSYESEDSEDSDPFERLRAERQRERQKRISNYWQRYFGPHVKVDFMNIGSLNNAANGINFAGSLTQESKKNVEKRPSKDFVDTELFEASAETLKFNADQSSNSIGADTNLISENGINQLQNSSALDDGQSDLLGNSKVEASEQPVAQLKSILKKPDNMADRLAMEASTCVKEEKINELKAVVSDRSALDISGLMDEIIINFPVEAKPSQSNLEIAKHSNIDDDILGSSSEIANEDDSKRSTKEQNPELKSSNLTEKGQSQLLQGSIVPNETEQSSSNLSYGIALPKQQQTPISSSESSLTKEIENYEICARIQDQLVEAVVINDNSISSAAMVRSIATSPMGSFASLKSVTSDEWEVVDSAEHRNNIEESSKHSDKENV